MPTRRSAPLALAALLLVVLAGLTACQPVPNAAADPGAKAVAAARQQIGQPYRSGGESRAEGGFDCSGLTSYAWKQAGVTLPRSSSAQHSWATKIARADLRPGDLVFYSSAGTRGAVTHVALYVGDGKVVQARKPGIPVGEAKVDFWAGHLVGFGRVKVAKG